MVGAHAARPICPHCTQPVRTGVQIKDACADVDMVLTLARRRAASGAPEDVDLYDWVVTTAVEYLRHLQAELAGEHVDCHHPMQLADLQPDALAERMTA